MILRYIYGGRLSLEEFDASDIVKILIASSELSLQDLVVHLQLFLIENKKVWMEQNFNLIYKTSFKNDSFLKLQNFCTELMTKEPEKIFNSNDFISLSEKCLISLIQHDKFQVNVIQVWEQVLKWGIAQNFELSSDPSSYSKDDFNTLKNTLHQLIPFIKLSNLNHKEFSDKVYPYKKILPKDLRGDLIRHFLNQPNYNIATSNKQENLPTEKDFNIIAEEINNFIYKLLNEGIDRKLEKQKVNEYFNDHNLNSQKLYDWLVNNQIRTNSIFLFGYFNYHGIATSENYDEALNSFICALELDHKLAQYFVGECYLYGHGTIKNENLAFKYYEQAADKNILCGQNSIGYCYENGLGSYKDLQKAFYWYEKAANNGNIKAMYNLGNCYKNGIGVKEDYDKAFELFQKSAEKGYPDGIMMLGYCYDEGIGTKINNQKALELYQNAENLGYEVAQYNLTLMSIAIGFPIFE
ncbi:kinase-like domain-containing protein [Rhizophagus clarus]|uniref:Kinase-like domain-containing protein n=1 Tax=Rhizophagus clarus TaxID=94130 RepID=A0A8H3MFZ0_9GLOM|nr:kinase-like domain-containing protein [Rhizophagus clarus]